MVNAFRPSRDGTGVSQKSEVWRVLVSLGFEVVNLLRW